MAGTLDVIVKFIGDSSKLRGEVAQIEGTGSKIKKWATGVGAAVGGAFAVAKVQDFIQKASSVQDAVAAAGEVFEDGAPKIEKWADEAAAAFGMSKSQALDALNNVAAFGKGAGLAGDELAGFSTDLVGLAGDLASFRGTSPEQAIQAIGSALQGQAEPLRAYGVLLDAGTIKARALSMGLVQATGDADKIKAAQLRVNKALEKYNKVAEEHGKDSAEAAEAATQLELAQSGLAKATEGTVPELTQQQKVMATQAEIFAQTGDAQGDFERTSDSAANAQKTMTAEMENAQAAIGNALLPVVQKILPYITKMANFFEKNATVLVPLVAILGGFAIALKIAAVAAAIFNASLGPVLLIVLAVAAAIAAIVAIGYLIVQNWDTIKAAASAVWQALQTAWDAVLGVLQGVWNWIKENWPLLLAILTGPFGLAVLFVTKNFDTIQKVLQAVWDWVKSTWSQLSNLLTAPFRIASSAISGLMNGVKSIVQGAWDFISGIVTSIIDTVLGIPAAIGNIGGRIADVIKAPINAIIRGWNNLRIQIPEFDPLGRFGPSVGGQTIDFPNIPELAKGGVVTQTGLALVHEGEAFSGVGRTFGGNTYNINVNVTPGTDPAQTGRALVDVIRAYERANGATVLASP